MWNEPGIVLHLHHDGQPGFQRCMLALDKTISHKHTLAHAHTHVHTNIPTANRKRCDIARLNDDGAAVCSDNRGTLTTSPLYLVKKYW